VGSIGGYNSVGLRKVLIVVAVLIEDKQMREEN
jgi:hypothetical protein